MRKYPNSGVVLARIHSGIAAEMRRFVGIRSFLVLALVGAWRGASELLERRRELVAAGVLDTRIAARRAGRIDRALAAAGLVRAELVPARVHASVSVGSSVRTGSDVDDVGLLEGAMRRAARERMAVTSDGVARRPFDRSSVVVEIPDPASAHDWGSMIVDGHAVVRERRARIASVLAAWPIVSLVAACLLTFVPLVRPLNDVSPWLALGGVALAVAGVLGSRVFERREAEDAELDAELED